MAEIKPFNGYFYNPNKIKSLSQVIAPPYDVIPIEEREEYYARKHNIINLILPKETTNQDKYQHSASMLNEWLRDGIFMKGDKSSFYLYHQHFLANNENLLRKGFFALVRLEDFADGKILPHENTLSSPKEDRFKLLNATRTNLSPIFLIYSDENNEVMKSLEQNKEESTFADFVPLERKNSKYIPKGFPHPLGKKHTLWRISNLQTNDKIKEIIKQKTLYIADGHHRYETALKFWKENKKDYNRWILAYISPMEDDSLKIFPAHRLLKDFSLDDWKKLNNKACDFFFIKELPLNDIDKSFKLIREEGHSRHAFGVVHNDNGAIKTLLFVSKNEKKLLGKMQQHSPAWKHLDVSVLHSLIFSHILGYEEKELQDTLRLAYEVDRYKAIDLVKNGTYQIAFLLNPTKVEEVKLVANRQERMPGKATYFYPKVPTGFFVNVFEK
ncbi:MAG: DUF1015 domain-containing protein [Candidatus Omnitrophica bacterium]|nr:DUF1015 domain-containing protein [Candidatus Omnitrophota bacterium]MBU1048010.1 DUF1015 domain-containing protein [Candidatus Omnitrophota bacterium]MBU1630434.1 DUF1015 domain-containing protein [Candidatus Omnitrophota bacterium]MBU1889380.1 DUF1015 domain-containing protein [Candidatus Omnitrophota bacterium]